MNEKKFTEVFNKYNRLVRKMVISRSGNDMLAEEICQQVFLQYFEQMNNISEELYDKKKEWYYVIMDICILQMSYEEAAKHLNIEVQVLRARLYRARRYIRKKYGEEYQEL